jgi:alanyl-tRNA synthetase
MKMKKCNSGETCPVSGENLCCKSCEKLQTCEDACNEALDLTANCPDEVEEPDALTVFQTKETAVIQAMSDLLKQKKALEEQEKQIREKLVETMDAYGIKSFENDLLKVTYVAATSKTSIDSKALKKDLPDIAEKYSKTSPVAASVRISLK